MNRPVENIKATTTSVNLGTTRHILQPVSVGTESGSTLCAGVMALDLLGARLTPRSKSDGYTVTVVSADTGDVARSWSVW